MRAQLMLEVAKGRKRLFCFCFIFFKALGSGFVHALCIGEMKI